MKKTQTISDSEYKVLSPIYICSPSLNSLCVASNSIAAERIHITHNHHQHQPSKYTNKLILFCVPFHLFCTNRCYVCVFCVFFCCTFELSFNVLLKVPKTEKTISKRQATEKNRTSLEIDQKLVLDTKIIISFFRLTRLSASFRFEIHFSSVYC